MLDKKDLGEPINLQILVYRGKTFLGVVRAPTEHEPGHKATPVAALPFGSKVFMSHWDGVAYLASLWGKP